MVSCRESCNIYIYIYIFFFFFSFFIFIICLKIIKSWCFIDTSVHFNWKLQ